MDPDALIPYGLALLGYFQGDSAAQLIIRRDDGFEGHLPVAHFFRTIAELSPIEIAALEHCRGQVLDIGAGSGIHSLELQSRGLKVTAIDIMPQAVEIMVQRGVQRANVGDIFQFRDGRFDTLLMLGHGIGMVENLEGLRRFLAHARLLLRDDGQLLLDSLDVRRTDEPSHLAYHDANRRAGRYIGETRVQFDYEGRSGPFCGWLHVDPQTLAESAEKAGWSCDILLEQDQGDYLARLMNQEYGS